MSVWQACNVAGVDVLSLGSDSMTSLPAWAIELATRYGVVLTWLDEVRTAQEVAQQLPRATPLRSPKVSGVKVDANVALVAGRLGEIIQTYRLRSLAPALREGVIANLWEWRDLIDEGQRKVAAHAAQELGIGEKWPFD